jgi:hypothetical protein
MSLQNLSLHISRLPLVNCFSAGFRSSTRFESNDEITTNLREIEERC